MTHDNPSDGLDLNLGRLFERLQFAAVTGTSETVTGAEARLLAYLLQRHLLAFPGTGYAANERKP